MPSAHRLPSLTISLDGSPLPAADARGFTTLRVHQTLSQPSVCELTFTGLNADTPLPTVRIGATLSVAIQGHGTPLFEGCVTATETSYSPQRVSSLAVRAYDELFILRNRQSARAHVGLSTPELSQELVADLGLKVDAQTSGPKWPRVLQVGTDFDVLDDLTARCGLHMVVQERCLKLITLQGTGEAWPLHLHENLLEARIEVNSHGACRKVSVNGWDPWRSVVCSGDAISARVGRAVRAEASASLIGGRDDRTLLARSLQDNAQAEACAQAELDLCHAQEVVLRGTALGAPHLRPGARVEVMGVQPSLAGIYVITSTTHTLDAEQGYQTELSTAPPLRRDKPSGSSMTLGKVLRIDDPDHLGRIQVTLPAFGDVESDWLQLMAPGAGLGKGLIALPNVGDIVLLQVNVADPAQAIVLGSLYGEKGLPLGLDVLGENACFGFLTPGGHRLSLDDGGKRVRLESSDGSAIEMSRDAVKLHAKAPMTIEAPGEKITLRAKFIDFERG